MKNNLHINKEKIMIQYLDDSEAFSLAIKEAAANNSFQVEIEANEAPLLTVFMNKVKFYHKLQELQRFISEGCISLRKYHSMSFKEYHSMMESIKNLRLKFYLIQ